MKSTSKKPLPLSEREIRVLKLICREKNCTEIAEQIGVSVRQAERVKHDLLIKTKCRTTIGLYKWALKKNVVKP